MLLRWLPALLLLALAPCAALAQTPAADSAGEDDEQPLNEVFQTELVYPQGKGEVQITFAPRTFSNDTDDVVSLPLGVEYGITDRWQVSVEWETFARVRLDDGGRAQGAGDVELGTKYAFMNIHGSHTHAAVGLDVGLPTGDAERGLSEGLVEVSPFVLAAHDFSSLHRTQLFGSAGVSLVHRTTPRPEGDAGDEPATDPHSFLLNVGAFVPVRRVRPTFELNWVTDQWNNHGHDSEIYTTPGIVWVPAEHWEFGVALPVGISHDATRLQFTANIIFEFDTRHEER